MSAISRATLRQSIRFLGDFKNVKRFPSTDINTIIQQKFDRFWAIVDEAHQGWWDKEGTITTVTGQAYLALPTDCKAVKAMDRLDGSDYVEMVQVGLSERNRWGSSRGKPQAYRLSSRGLELYPTPDAAYTLRVIYTPKPDTLDEDTTHEWYEGWEDYVLNAVILELKTREGMPLGDYADKLIAAEKALRASTSQRRQAEPEYLRLCEYDGIDLNDDGIY